MAENSFQNTVEALFKGMDSFITPFRLNCTVTIMRLIKSFRMMPVR